MFCVEAERKHQNETEARNNKMNRVEVLSFLSKQAESLMWFRKPLLLRWRIILINYKILSRNNEIRTIANIILAVMTDIQIILKAFLFYFLIWKIQCRYVNRFSPSSAPRQYSILLNKIKNIGIMITITGIFVSIHATSEIGFQFLYDVIFFF